MANPLVAFALYGAVLLAAGWYLLFRVRLSFTARGCFLALFFVLFGPAHYYYYFLIDPAPVTTLGAYDYHRIDPRTYQRLGNSLVLMWVFVLAGMELTWRLARRSAARADWNRRRWRWSSIADDPSTDRALAVAGWIVAGLLAAATIYENPFLTLGTFVRLTGATNLIAELRGTAGGSRFYWCNLLVASVAPFLSFAAVLRAWKQRRPASWALAGMLVLLVAVQKTALLTRSALPIYLLQLAIAPVLARSLRIRPALFAAAFLLLGLLVYPFNYHYLGVSPAQFAAYFVDRTLLAPYYGLFNYFWSFPDLVPHALGRNIRVLNWFFYDDPGYVPAMVLFAQRAGNYLGTFNGMFIGEAWADFGYRGVAAESFALGVVLAVADLWIFSKGKSPEGVAAVVSVIFGMITLSATALQTSLFSGGILLVPFVVIVLRSVRVPKLLVRSQLHAAAGIQRP